MGCNYLTVITDNYNLHIHMYVYMRMHVCTYVSWCGGESWVDQRISQTYIHDVALLP